MDSVQNPFLFSGRSDCYGSLDERNVLACSPQKQVGFEFQCDSNVANGFCLSNSDLCNTPRCSNGYDEALCKAQLSHADKKRRRCDGTIASAEEQYLDSHCYNGTCITRARCNEKCECNDCEDEYYCITIRYFGTYRAYTAYVRYLFQPQLIQYPPIDLSDQSNENATSKKKYHSDFSSRFPPFSLSSINEKCVTIQQTSMKSFSRWHSISDPVFQRTLLHSQDL